MITISAIFFRILNALIVFGVIGYCFKKYILPSMRRSLEQEKAIAKNYELKKEMIKEQRDELEKRIVVHEELGNRLSNNIRQWAESVEKQKQVMNENNNLIAEKISQRVFARLQNKQEKLIANEIIRPAIAQARNDLQIQFSSSANGNRYIQDLISKIEKKKV